MNQARQSLSLRRLNRVLRVLLPLAIVGLVVVGWQLYATYGGLNANVFPSFTRVLEQGWQHRADLLRNTLPTLRATLIGFSVSLAVGFALSIVIDRFLVVRRAILPLLVVSQTLPLIAVAPLMVLWFGFTLLPKVLIVVLVTFFPIVVSLVSGYSATDRDSEVLLRSMGAGRWRTFRTLRLPTALPYFFSGLRIAITYAVVAAIFAEYAGAENGLGIFMQNAKNSFRTDLVIAAVLVSSVLTLTLFGLTYVLERVFVQWSRVTKQQGKQGTHND